MSNYNKEVVRRLIDEGWNKRNMAIFRETLSADCTHDLPGVDGPSIGPDAYQHTVEGFVHAFPDARMDIGDMVAEGQHVCVVWTFTGTHTGPLGEIQPTGRRIVVRGIGHCRLHEGKINAIVSQFNHGGMISELTRA